VRLAAIVGIVLVAGLLPLPMAAAAEHHHHHHHDGGSSFGTSAHASESFSRHVNLDPEDVLAAIALENAGLGGFGFGFGFGGLGLSDCAGFDTFGFGVSTLDCGLGVTDFGGLGVFPGDIRVRHTISEGFGTHTHLSERDALLALALGL
jgi:hypothetical protein